MDKKNVYVWYKAQNGLKLLINYLRFLKYLCTLVQKKYTYVHENNESFFENFFKILQVIVYNMQSFQQNLAVILENLTKLEQNVK